MWQITAGVRGVRWQERKAQRGVTQGGRQGPGLSPGHRPWDPPVGEVAGRVEASRESQGWLGDVPWGCREQGWWEGGVSPAGEEQPRACAGMGLGVALGLVCSLITGCWPFRLSSILLVLWDGRAPTSTQCRALAGNSSKCLAAFTGSSSRRSGPFTRAESVLPHFGAWAPSPCHPA